MVAKQIKRKYVYACGIIGSKTKRCLCGVANDVVFSCTTMYAIDITAFVKGFSELKKIYIWIFFKYLCFSSVNYCSFLLNKGKVVFVIFFVSQMLSSNCKTEKICYIYAPIIFVEVLWLWQFLFFAVVNCKMMINDNLFLIDFCLQSFKQIIFVFQILKEI